MGLRRYRQGVGESIDGDRVRAARVARGETQAVVVARLGGGMTNAHLSQIELGHRGVQDRTLRALAVALGVSADYLLGLTDDPAPAAKRR
jgi:transcriptional regulator with XRE-family HTH domain